MRKVLGSLWRNALSAAAALALLCSCSARVAHWMHWSHDFANGRRAPVASSSAARAAALQYVHHDESAAGQYSLDSVRAVANGKVWLVNFPLRQGGEPGQSVMGINRKTGRIGWLSLK